MAKGKFSFIVMWRHLQIFKKIKNKRIQISPERKCIAFYFWYSNAFHYYSMIILLIDNIKIKHELKHKKEEYLNEIRIQLKWFNPFFEYESIVIYIESWKQTRVKDTKAFRCVNLCRTPKFILVFSKINYFKFLFRW